MRSTPYASTSANVTGFLPLRDSVAGATVGMVMLVPTAMAAAVGGPVAAVTAVLVGGVMHNAF